MKEIWKPVAGYEGIYEVSNFGKIRSSDRLCRNNRNGGYRLIKAQIIKPIDNGNGYMTVHLKRKNKRQMRYVHRLVAEAFCEKSPRCNVVNHIDFNKENNNATNLEWCTQAQNIEHSKHRMRKPKTVVTSNTGEKYICYRKSKGLYRVVYKPARIDKSFKTLEAAVAYRDEVLNENGITA